MTCEFAGEAVVLKRSEFATPKTVTVGRARLAQDDAACAPLQVVASALGHAATVLWLRFTNPTPSVFSGELASADHPPHPKEE